MQTLVRFVIAVGIVGVIIVAVSLRWAAAQKEADTKPQAKRPVHEAETAAAWDAFKRGKYPRLTHRFLDVSAGDVVFYGRSEVAVCGEGRRGTS